MSRLNFFLKSNMIEVGLDEVARGCLAGPVFAAAVIWNKNINNLDCPEIKGIKDSKKMNKQKRTYYSDYIKNNCLDWAISYINEKRIDEINIRNASMEAMHDALNKLRIIPEHIIVDGNYFKEYNDPDNNNIIPYTTVVKGDNKYLSIASASILAKVARDDYMKKLVEENKELEIYNWIKNSSYGTKDHLDAIKKYGICKYHRKTFGICKNY